MEFEASQELLSRAVMKYLRDQKHFDSLCMLIAETGIGEVSMSPELEQVQNMVIAGR
jgi:hypothetical protein